MISPGKAGILNNRFRFHGYAVGAAGRMDRPFTDLIEVQASSAVPRIGGRASGRSVGFQYRDIIRFDLAHTEVTADICDDDCGGDKISSAHTQIRSTIEGLNILSMVTADRLVANLVSTANSTPETDPTVRLLGTRFENLRIAGIPVQVDLGCDVFDRYDTHTSLATAYRTDAAVRNLIDPPGAEKASDCEMPATRGSTRASLVRGICAEGPGLEIEGHVIRVQGFGTIRLAEVELTKRTRLVTMLQIDFDCPYQGRVMFCEIADGGEGY